MFGQFRNPHYPASPMLYNGKPTTVSPVPFTSINCILEANSEHASLYVGDVMCVRRPEILAGHRIVAVLCCGEEAKFDLSRNPYQIDEYKVIMAKDLYDYDMAQHFEEAYEFIDRHLKAQHNTLVHCHAGVSRSVTIVVAYFMKKYSWTVDQALSFIRSKRPRAKPNESFMKQLRQYQQKLFSTKNLSNTQSTSQMDNTETTDRLRTPQKRTVAEVYSPRTYSQPRNDYQYQTHNQWYTPQHPINAYYGNPYNNYPPNLNRNIFGTPQPQQPRSDMYHSRSPNYPLGNVYLQPNHRPDIYTSRFVEPLSNAGYL